jgi:hypothetical protein
MYGHEFTGSGLPANPDNTMNVSSYITRVAALHVSIALPRQFGLLSLPIFDVPTRPISPYLATSQTTC